MVLSKYLSNFWRTLEMPLINCEIDLILTWSANYFIIDALVDNHVPTLAITDTKLYILVVTLSKKDNAKLLERLKSGFKRTIHCNKHRSKVRVQKWDRYSDYLLDPSFQGVNRLSLLLFENTNGRRSHKRHYLPQVEVKNYNVVIDGLNHLGTFGKIWKITISQGQDFTNGCLLGSPYFKHC